jgi:hypothetical protein
MPRQPSLKYSAHDRRGDRPHKCPNPVPFVQVSSVSGQLPLPPTFLALYAQPADRLVPFLRSSDSRGDSGAREQLVTAVPTVPYNAAKHINLVLFFLSRAVTPFSTNFDLKLTAHPVRLILHFGAQRARQKHTRSTDSQPIVPRSLRLVQLAGSPTQEKRATTIASESTRSTVASAWPHHRQQCGGLRSCCDAGTSMPCKIPAQSTPVDRYRARPHP